ncbi:hypothetical protein H4Q26_013998 [Puccinia striiformis f. sp. tritici PST-130]|nr:hypothetical protein H4Q26_013998 [Puccinia striiformis f. sp. tritici PST-130]
MFGWTESTAAGNGERARTTMSSSAAHRPPPPSTTTTTSIQKTTADSTSSHLLEYFIAGGTAGAMSRTVVSPLERLKIIFQCQGPGSPTYQGMWPSLVKIGKKKGGGGISKGMELTSSESHHIQQSNSHHTK